MDGGRVQGALMDVGREHWFGAKPLIRRLLAMPGVNNALLASLRHLPPSPTLARLPVSRREVVGHARDISYVLVRPERCSIARELYWGRGRRVARDEQLSLDLFADLASGSDVALDIGANTGVFSLVASLANPRAKVHAFEIVPEIYEVLVENIVRNDVAHRVTCHLRGIGTDGMLVRLPPAGKASSLPTSFSSDTTSSTGVTVAFGALDALRDSVAADASVLIKIDVEGTELAIFREGWKFIDAFRPLIICEILRPAAHAAALGEDLKRRGYRLFNVTDEGLVPHETLSANPNHRDWLFSPHDVDALRRLTTVPVQG